MGGPLDGTRLDIDDAVDEILVGSDPDCRLCLDLPGVSPIHARIWRDLGGVTVYDTRSPRGVYVNDSRVTDQAALHDGDVLWLGEPGDPDSVMLQCRLPEEGLLGAPVGEPVGENQGEPVSEPEADASPLDALVPPEPMPAMPPPAAAAAAPPEPDASVLDGLDDLVDAPVEAEPTAAAEAIDPDDVGGATVMFRRTPEAAPPAPAPAPEEPIEVFDPEADFLAVEPPPPAPPAIAPEPVGDAWAKDAQPALAPLPPVDLDLLVDEPIDMGAPAAAANPASVGASAPVVPEAMDSDPPDAEVSSVDPTPLDLADAWEAPPTRIGHDEPEDLVAGEEAPDTTFFTDDAEPAAPAAAAPAIPPSPTPPPVPASAASPAPVTPTPRRPVVAAPPPSPPRAIIDDTRPRDAAGEAPRKPRATRAGAPEDVMDWARASPAAGPAEVPSSAPRAGKAARGAPSGSKRGLLIPVAAVALIAAAAGGYFLWSGSRTPQVQSVSPARARVGDTLTLTGAHLGEAAGDVTVTIGGRPGKVLQAAGTRLTVEVPEVATAAGRDTAAPVVVAVSGRESKPATVALFQAPRLRALSPEVGMPGDEVALTGTSLEKNIRVTFGGVPAEVVDAAGETLRVKVPAIPGPPGTEVPVEATMGADKSNAIAFVLGRVPLVTRLDARNAAPGELVTVTGRGFDAQPEANRVTVGGVPALVVSATAREIKAVVPRLPTGESSLRVTVPGSANAGEAPLAIDPSDDPIGFRFVAEPFADTPGHEHAALATGLGPAFILSSGAGKRAAERAYEAQRALNDAAQVFASSREADIRAEYEPRTFLFVYGRSTPLFDVSEADAAAYGEDWTRAGTRGGPVTTARLAAWWEAVARDLVLLLVRGEKPVHAAALAAEGKALADLHDAARRMVSRGVPAALVAEGRSPFREGLRVVALRVPATVQAPAAAAGTVAPSEPEAAPAAGAPAVPPLRLDGAWTGFEFEGGMRKSIAASFRGSGGTLTYQRALAMSVPIQGAAQQRGAVRFEIPTGGGKRYYRGQWDGEKISGKLYLDAEGRREAGTFELQKAE